MSSLMAALVAGAVDGNLEQACLAARHTAIQTSLGLLLARLRSADGALFVGRLRTLAGLLINVCRVTKGLSAEQRSRASLFFASKVFDVVDSWTAALERNVLSSVLLMETSWQAFSAANGGSAPAADDGALRIFLDSLSAAPESVPFASDVSDFVRAVVDDIVASNALPPPAADFAAPSTSASFHPRLRRPFPRAHSYNRSFAAHLVHTVGDVHARVAQRVRRSLSTTEQDCGTLVLVTSSCVGKTKVAYSLAKAPTEGILPVLVRVAGRLGLTSPWQRLANALESVRRVVGDAEDANKVGFALHQLLFSTYLEWILHTWELAEGGSHVPEHFLEFAARVLWNGTSDEAVQTRFHSLVPPSAVLGKFTTVDAHEFQVRVTQRLVWLKDRLVGLAASLGVRAPDGVSDPVVTLFVDEVSEWDGTSCFRSRRTKAPQSNVYGLVAAGEGARTSGIAMVAMGTAWSFSRSQLMLVSSYRADPSVMSDFHVFNVDDMCAILEHYVDFGDGGVFPELREALRLLRGRPAFFVDGFLAELADRPDLLADRAGLVELAGAVFADHAQRTCTKLETESTVSGLQRPDAHLRCAFVRELVLALGHPEGTVETSRFVSAIATTKTPSDDERKAGEEAFARLVHVLGFVIQSDTCRTASVLDEPVLTAALRAYVERRCTHPSMDSLLGFFASQLRLHEDVSHKGRILERALAWHIAKPRHAPVPFPGLFDLPVRAWSSAFEVDASEIVFFQLARHHWHTGDLRVRAQHPQWTDEMFRSELHALFDWSDPDHPTPVLNRVVAFTIDCAAGPDLLFFTHRALRSGRVSRHEFECGGRAVRLVVVQCKSGETDLRDLTRSLNLACLYAAGGSREDRVAVLDLVLRADLQLLFRSCVRMVASVSSPTAGVTRALIDWNSGHIGAPLEFCEVTPSIFGPELSTELRRLAPDKTVGMPVDGGVAELVDAWDEGHLAAERAALG